MMYLDWNLSQSGAGLVMFWGLELVTKWSWVGDVFWDWNLSQCGAGLVMYFGIGTCHKVELG